MTPSSSLLSASLLLTGVGAAHNLPSLYVENAPDYVRPYIIEHYAPAQAVSVGQQVYRFPVTGMSSGGKLTLLSTVGPSSNALGVLPHQHYTHYENFFCLDGRYQLWTDKYGDEEGRLLTPGDYGSVPTNTTHSFQLLDPLTELVGAIVPGGFEDLFFAIADKNYTAETLTPYVPATSNNSAGGGSSESIISALESFDVWSQFDFNPRRDFVNGSAPASNWHTGTNSLPMDFGTPYYIAKDHGPMYLNNASSYQIVQPFVTPIQAGPYNFTLGTITSSRLHDKGPFARPATLTLDDHIAFEVISGVLMVEIEDHVAQLTNGDVVFVPGGVPWRYWSGAVFTKFLYLAAGSSNLDQMLIKNATEWNYPVFPTSY